MCSYLGGYPPHLARRILEEWVPKRATVLDPFCGSGTTLAVAALRRNPCIGIDLNPLAVALSRAKLQSTSVPDLEDRLRDLALRFPGEGNYEAPPDDIRVIFHDRTLAQLEFLREELDPSNPEDAFLIGSVLGIMHGKSRKDGGTSYLSIDMPNTFSMSPNYVRDFVRRNNLRKPSIDVFRQLHVRVRWLLRDGTLPTRNGSAIVLEGDAVKAPHLLASIGRSSVGAVVTSPPYLGLLRYGAFNWIRLWFLKVDPTRLDEVLDSTDSLDRYLSFMASLLGSLAKVVRPEARVILVIGDVSENGQYVKLAERVWEEIGGLIPFELENLEADRYDDTVKTTRIWGDERKGMASPMDRIMVLRRVRQSGC